MKSRFFSQIGLSSQAIIVGIALLTFLSLRVQAVDAVEQIENRKLSASQDTEVQILEPDWIDLKISYNYANQESFTEVMSGILLQIIEVHSFRVDGPTTFTDGTICSKLFTINFKGLWNLAATFNFGNLHTSDSNDFELDCSLSFGLTEDGSTWRIVSGALPGALARQTSIMAEPYKVGICHGATDSYLNNDLSHYSRYVEGDFQTATGQQTLTTDACNSPYPNFQLSSDYDSTLEMYGGTVRYYAGFWGQFTVISGIGERIICE